MTERTRRIIEVLDRIDYRNQTPQRLAEAIIDVDGLPQSPRDALEQAKSALIKIRKCSIAGAEEGYGKPELWAEALFVSHGDVHSAIKAIDAALSDTRPDRKCK